MPDFRVQASLTAPKAAALALRANLGHRSRPQDALMKGWSSMSDLFTIRDARMSDMPLIDSYAHESGMDNIPGPDRVRVAVNEDDQVVGFCRLQDDANGIAYVNPIVTYSAWRGYGVGSALIEDARQLAGELRLIARGTSEAFYRKIGFVDMDWSETDQSAASEDCDNCPYRAECGPVPMKLDAPR